MEICAELFAGGIQGLRIVLEREYVLYKRSRNPRGFISVPRFLERKKEFIILHTVADQLQANAGHRRRTSTADFIYRARIEQGSISVAAEVVEMIPRIVLPEIGQIIKFALHSIQKCHPLKYAV